MRTRILPLFLFVSFVSLHAQDRDSSAQQPPTGPLLKRVSAPAQWTILTQVAAPQPGADSHGNAGSASTGNAAGPAKAAKPRVTTVIKSENLIYEKVVDESGNVIESWRTPTAMATRVNATGWAVLPGVGNNFNQTDYSKADFAGFDWVALSHYTGTGSVLGRKCLIFKSREIVMDAASLHLARLNALNKLISHDLSDYSISDKNVSDDQFKVDVEADIDQQTRLPVKLTYQTAEGTTTRTYTFETAGSSLELPPEVRAAVGKFQKYLKSMSVPIAPI
jgi:hypothetical protein